MEGIKIVSLNVRGLKSFNKRKETFNFLRQKAYDVICLQEMHIEESEHDLVKKQWGGPIYFSQGTNRRAGVAILVKPKSEIQVIPRYNDRDGRSLIVEVNQKDQVFLLANIYGPNQDDPDFFVKTLKEINKLNATDLILMGDFNVVLDPQMDRIDHKNYAPSAQKIILEFMNQCDMCDPWRLRNPDTTTYSWIRRKSKHSYEVSGSRIDLMLTSMSLVNLIRDIYYSYGYKTDHSMLIAEITNNKSKRGPGY